MSELRKQTHLWDDALAILTRWNFKFQSFTFMFCAVLVVTWIQCNSNKNFYGKIVTRSVVTKQKISTKYYCENFNTILLDGYTMIGS